MTRLQPDRGELKLYNEASPAVKLEEAYKYVGIKDSLEISVHQGKTLRVMSKAKKDITKMFRTALLPWQKLSVVLICVISRFDYNLRHCNPYKQHLVSFGCRIRAALKGTLMVSKGTASEVFH